MCFKIFSPLNRDWEIFDQIHAALLNNFKQHKNDVSEGTIK